MDERASHHMEMISINGSHPSHDELIHEPWPVILSGNKICSNLQKNLIHGLQSENIDQYWSSKWFVSHEVYIQCDFDSLSAARSSLSVEKRSWVSKMMSGWLATQDVLKRRKLRTHSACPLCLGHEKGVFHIWSCQHPIMVQHSIMSLSRLQHWLDDINTSPMIRKYLPIAILSWKSKFPSVPEEITMLTLSQHQQLIGWDNFFRGFLTPQWATIQQYYYEGMGYKKSGTNWSKGLILLLWSLTKYLWLKQNEILHHEDGGDAQVKKDFSF